MPTPDTGVGPGWSSPLPAGGATIGGPPALPASPPGAAPPAATSGEGSAVELRKERDRVQAQLDRVQANIDRQTAADPDYIAPPEITNQITALNGRIATLTQQITQAEQRAPSVIAGGSPNDKYIIRQAPDGTIMTDPTTGQPPLNPNWDGKTERPQVANIGTHIVTIGTDGTVTAAYTDVDAQELARRQTAVAEAQSRVAQAQAATTEYATRARIELEQRASRNEDAASVRAEQALRLQELHQQWVEADGDARRAAEDLRDYNTDRHQTAAETLSRDQLGATQQWQQMQDATARRAQDITAAGNEMSNATTLRGQDISSATSRRSQDIGERTAASDRSASTRTSLANARLGAGQQYMANVLSMMAQLNRDAPPGSSAVGDMLAPLLAVGKDYFGQLGGLDSADAILAAGGMPLNTGGAASSATAPDPSRALALPDAAPASLAGVAPDLDRGVTTPSLSGSDATTDRWFEEMMQRRREMALRGGGNGYGYVPAFAEGGVVTQPTLAMVGEAGPEAIVPLGGGAPPLPSGTTGLLGIVGDFLSKLSGAVEGGSAAPQLPAPGGDPSALAGQAAAASGLPPAAGANPMLPGSAAPGLPPAAAASQARMAPIGPDGSPYASPGDVAARLAARRSTRPALGPAPAAPAATAPATAGLGV